MYFSAIIAGLLGLAQLSHGSALPPRAEDTGFVVSLTASDYFPHAKGDLTPFDISAYFANYDADTKAWLTALNPHTATTDEDKARMLTEAAYARKFDANDADMAEDVQTLLAAVAGNTTTTGLTKRSNFVTDNKHAVYWAACAGFFSCISGTTCTFDLQIGKAPRSHCEQQGGSNCCIAWSTYNVRVGFFSTTWTACNNEVQAEGKTSASCEGYGSSDQGGDVCLSNRANGCT
ncbi:hypothetical protein BJX96DRAFT_142848 [Aspergillus floccosus]